MSTRSSLANSTVLFRVDGSPQIGFGHISRCLALADALRERNLVAVFVLKNSADAVAQLLESRGFQVEQLPATGDEATALIEISRQQQAQMVCVDSYGFDAAYLQTLQDVGLAVTFIDDFARFYIPAQIVVNQNAYALASDYAVAAGTRLLVGPRYALLNRDFSRLRQIEQSAAPGSRPAGTVLVIVGGSDPLHWSGQIAEALFDALPGVRIIVVLGPLTTGGAELATLAASEARLTILRQPSNLPEIMAQSSIAVSGAGVTAYELACLGVPSVLVVVAENQRKTATALAAAGIACVGGSYDDFDPAQVAAAAAALLANQELLQQMALAGRQLVDGRGADRVAEEIGHEINTRYQRRRHR